MTCPLCNIATGVEIDMHSDGYAKDLFECTECGSIWVLDRDGIVLLNNRAA
ncbi:MAG: hypothetical protein HZC44_06455 [Geobacter sp.]|nr:hypothetical protein [Geobacter sp.]